MTEPGPTPPDLAPAVVLDVPGLRLSVIPTGWIAVRPAHREFRRPWPVRLPAILASTRWAAWMPVHVFVVEHATGTVVVDTGEAADQPQGHFGCGSPAQESFYRSSLRIPVRPGDDAPARLRAHGIDPASVDTVVLTHLHSDHAGNLADFPHATILVGAAERSAAGAVGCRLDGHRARTPTFDHGPRGPFEVSHSLTHDGAVRVVPLPGHTPGHLGLTVGDDRTHVIAGDAAFDHDQIRRRATSAITHDRSVNRRTHARLARVLDDGGRVLLSHDPAALDPSG